MASPFDITTATFVLTLDGMADVTVERDLPFGDGLSFDLYRPAAPADASVEGPRGAVILVTGYADARLAALLGKRPRDIALAASWGRLVAASGLIGIVYGANQPITDLGALLAHLREHGGALGIDAARLGLWAASGNAPTGLAHLGAARAAVFCSPYMPDRQGDAHVGPARAFGFALPPTFAAVPSIPMFVMRSGADATPGLAPLLDRFISDALASDLPIEIVNLPKAPHAFELYDPRPSSLSALRRAFAFLAEHLG